MAQDSAAFDPHYYFLGISPKEGPLDHYRLLGLETFESNDEIIEMAADRQMGHLQRHESGDHIDAVAELLGEVSRARLCLLQDEHRQQIALDLATAAAASGQAQLEANFIIYRDYPSELLPKAFVDQQEKLQEDRKADALKSLDLAAKYVQSRKVTLKSYARKEFQKVMDMKLFLPVEAARAESLMRSYGLADN